ncbi:MAG: histidine phosphotransferase family protein [Kiloniellales bacterium]|nr:histidine phosphotransferase family protein [Kiloniellales bacterium]
MNEIRLTELLCSKLCHDLVGPIGAIGNGMELLAEEELGMADEALQLTALSTRRASAILQFYRIAYGLGQTERRQDPNFLSELAEGMLEGGRVSLDWPAEAKASVWPEGSGKLILNMISLAQEALPTGGTIRVAITENGSGAEISVTAEGKGVGFADATLEALAEGASVQQLTPRNVHGFFTMLLSQRIGRRIEISPQDGEKLRLSAQIPN